MKWGFLLMILPSLAIAGGPKYRYSDSKLNDEMVNIYSDISNVLKGDVRISSVTISTANIKGTSTNNSAPTGYLGEYVESLVTGNVAEPTSTQYGDLTSISLTAGDWDVTGIVYHSQEGATWTRTDGGISTTSGNSATGLTLGTTLVISAFASSATTPTIVILTVPNVRMSLAATTTVYLKYRADYSLGSPLARGARLSARRVR